MQLIAILIEGTWITVQITTLAVLLAVLIGFLAGLMRLSSFWIVRSLATVYIEVFRGTSVLVQLFWIFYVLPLFGIRFDAFTVGWLTLGLNAGAYGAEVVRGGILSVHFSQYEAATALNMGKWKSLRRIIIPQALPNMVPPWGNLFIELLKATSLVSLITIADVTFRAKQLIDQTFQTEEIFLIVLFIYLTIALFITAVMRIVERRLSRGLDRGGLK